MIKIADGDLAVSVDPDFGNNAFSFTTRGHEILWKPAGWPLPKMGGIPLLAPWANRIDGASYFVREKQYFLNPTLGNLRYDGNHLPIHGLLSFAHGWEVVEEEAASVTSRLKFWRFPQWMAQFPFAHRMEITHRLRDGSLEVETGVQNRSEESMPLCIGFHPYFQLSDSPREEWRVHLAVREEVTLNEKLIPTGEKRPLSLANPFPLKKAALDNVFSDLTGEDFVLEGREQRISVRYGKKFPVAIVYSPPEGSFVCFEPMTALTNAFNLDHAGIDRGLQWIPPGETWRESFWVKPEGF